MGWSNVGVGVVEAVTVIIQTGTAGSGVFVYDGVPAAGGLIGSWTAAAGTDPYGNTYGPGITVGRSTGPHLELNPSSAFPFGSGTLAAVTEYITTDPTETIPALGGALLFNGGAGNQQMATVYTSPVGTGQGSALVMTADSDDGTTTATITIGIVTASGQALTYTPLLTCDDKGNVTAASAFLVYTSSTAPVTTTFATAGAQSWTAPTGVTSVQVEAWGAGGGGQGGSGAGGGGGEYAAEPTLTVTPGHVYNFTVGAGGAGGPGGVGGPGSTGGTTTFAGDAVTVTAHGGQGSASATTIGGTGSTNAVHHNGGGSHANTTGVSTGGAGGGGSGGSASAGNAGTSNTGQSGGAGAVAVTNGGGGGNGGNGTGSGGAPGTAGAVPGGGGGTGGAGSSANTAGSVGGVGQVRITYTPPAATELVASMAGMATTDPLGSTVPAGFMGQIVATEPGVAPSTPEVWHNLTLVNSWSNAGGGFATAQYRMMPDDTVMCRGSITGGTAQQFATLPTGYRPPANVQFAVGGGATVVTGSTLRVGVTPAGVMTINGESVIGGAFGLDGIRFSVT